MSLREFKQRFDNIKRLAKDRWSLILPSLGIDAIFLKKRHGPCPCCGGTDRFRYIDDEGNGTWYCNGHRAGSGDGFQLLMDLHNWKLAEALSQVEAFLGGSVSIVQSNHRQVQVSMTPSISLEKQRLNMRKMWQESAAISEGDAVYRYLLNRGLVLQSVPKVLRCHKSLQYHHTYSDNEKSKHVNLGTFAGMLALVQMPDNSPVTLHRTYIKDSLKARIISPDGEILSPRKLMSKAKGGSIHLFEMTDDRLAIAEGIETALAVHLMTGLPVWAGISAGIMKNMVLPDSAKQVYIFADNDPVDMYGRRAGQDAAYALADRLHQEGRSAHVTVPSVVGSDFLDVYLQRQHRRTA